MKKKHNYKQPDKEGPLSKKNVQSKRIVTACCLLRFAAFFKLFVTLLLASKYLANVDKINGKVDSNTLHAFGH